MSDISFGRNATFAFAKETTYGEAWGSPTLIGLYLTKPPDLNPNIEPIKESHLSGRPELSTTDIQQGIKNWTLSIEGQFPKEALGFILLSLFGKVTTPAPSGGFYTHTFVPSTTSPASLKIQLRNPLATNDTEWRLRGGKVKSFKITFAQNSFVKFSAEFVGGGWARHTALSAAPSVPVPASGNLWYLWSSTPVCTIATANFPITSGELTFESVLSEDVNDSYEFGSSDRIRLERASNEDAFKVKGTLKAVWQSVTALTAYDAFTDLAIVLSFTDSTYAITNTLSHCRLLKAPTQVAKGLGLVEETVEFEAFTSGTEGDITLAYKDKQAEPAT